MPYYRYTPEQLHKLRESPLCRKPDGLPSLDQWMEQSAEQNPQRRKQQPNRGDEMGSFGDSSGAPRPLFPTRQSARNQEELFLGPPTTKFNSSGRARNAETLDKGLDHFNALTFGDDVERPSTNRNRSFRDQDDERARNRTDPARRANHRDADGEGWSTVNRRRSSQNEEAFDRWRGAERHRKEEETEEQPRRNGVGRGGRMGAWRDEQAESENNRMGGRWRDRERDRERDKDRDREWVRGQKLQDKVDEEPEWMNEPVKPQPSEEKTQEDFERWKAEQRAKSGAPPAEKEDSPILAKEMKLASKPLFDLSGFGTFGTVKKVEATPEARVEKPVPLKGLGKTSKFGAFFQKEETPPLDLEPEIQLHLQPQPQAQSQHTHQQPVPSDQATPHSNGPAPSKEDAEGFARILQMLGNTKVSSPFPNAGEGGGLAALFSPPVSGDAGQRVANSSRPDSANLVNELLARHSANRSRGPIQTAPAETEGATQYFTNQGGETARSNGRDENMMPQPGQMFSPGPPSNGRQRPETPNDQKRDLLLKLIEGNRAGKQPPPNADLFKQQQAAMMARNQAMLQQNQMATQDVQQRHAPSAPPGLQDAMLARGVGIPEHELQALRHAQRMKGQAALPSFFDDGPHDPAILGMPGLVRRNTTEQPPAHVPGHSQGAPNQAHLGPRPPVSNMGIPSQNAAVDGFRMNIPPNVDRNGPMPPPGFAPGSMRPPPGFQPQPPHLQSPGAHSGLRGLPPGMFPGGHMPMGPLPPGVQGGQNVPNIPMGGPMGQPLPAFFGPPPPNYPNEFFMRQGQGNMLPEELRRGPPGRGGPPPGFQM